MKPQETFIYLADYKEYKKVNGNCILTCPNNEYWRKRFVQKVTLFKIFKFQVKKKYKQIIVKNGKTNAHKVYEIKKIKLIKGEFNLYIGKQIK